MVSENNLFNPSFILRHFIGVSWCCFLPAHLLYMRASMGITVIHVHTYSVEMTNTTNQLAQRKCRTCDQRLREIMRCDWNGWSKRPLLFSTAPCGPCATLSLMGGGEFKALPHTTCCQRLPPLQPPILLLLFHWPFMTHNNTYTHKCWSPVTLAFSMV